MPFLHSRQQLGSISITSTVLWTFPVTQQALEVGALPLAYASAKYFIILWLPFDQLSLCSSFQVSSWRESVHSNLFVIPSLFSLLKCSSWRDANQNVCWEKIVSTTGESALGGKCKCFTAIAVWASFHKAWDTWTSTKKFKCTLFATFCLWLWTHWSVVSVGGTCLCSPR